MMDTENPPQEAVDPVDQYPTDTMDQMAAQAERLQMFQQMLIKRVGGWLKRALSETPGNA